MSDLDYRKFTLQMSVDDASLYCYGQDRHMDLASIVSKEENDWIVSRIIEIGTSKPRKNIPHFKDHENMVRLL